MSSYYTVTLSRIFIALLCDWRRRQSCRSSKRAQRQSVEFRDSETQAKAIKHQCTDFREKEAQAKATQRKCAEFRDKEAQAMDAKRQCTEFREKEAQAKATKQQWPEFRTHVKKQSWIRQACTPSTIIQACDVFIRATKEGPDYICIRDANLASG